MLSTCDQALSSSQYQETLAKDSFNAGLKDKIHNDVTPEDLNYKFNLRPFLPKYNVCKTAKCPRGGKKI